MDYNDILQEIKDNYFPELKEYKIKLKPLRILTKAFMITLPFSRNIHYNIKVIKRCSTDALRGVLAHELSHRVQYKKLNLLQRIFLVPWYHLNDEYRRRHELEAHTEAVKRGFGNEIIELNKFVKERYPKEVWDKKLSNYYLTTEEIKEMMLKYNHSSGQK